jgi:hypothetical protein
MEIASLGMTYRYDVKIDQKFKQNRQEFGSKNSSQPKKGKGGPNPHIKGLIKYVHSQENQSKSKHKNGNEKTKKDMGKWCEYHKIHWHNTEEFFSKKSLVVELKASESKADSESKSNIEGGKNIIDVEPSTTCTTTKFQPGEPEELEEGEHLFHSQMWVKGAMLHFIINSGSQKNLISIEFIERLDLPMTPHLQPYTIGWLHQGRDLHVSQQCCLPYDIKPFKEEVLCDISPLEVYDFILGQPYLWKHHVVYESRPHCVIITLGRQLYRILEVASPTVISLISSK